MARLRLLPLERQQLDRRQALDQPLADALLELLGRHGLLTGRGIEHRIDDHAALWLARAECGQRAGLQHQRIGRLHDRLIEWHLDIRGRRQRRRRRRARGEQQRQEQRHQPRRCHGGAPAHWVGDLVH